MAASPNIYLRGVGGASGDAFVTSSPLYILTAGRVWYVHHTGTDAASPSGRQREKPLATFNQAYTNSSEGDAIVFLPGHVETIASALTITKASLVIVSEGTGAQRARITAGVAGIILDMTAHSIQLRNIYFPASTVSPVAARTQFRGIGQVVKDCYFECGALDIVPACRLATSVGHTRFDGTTWVAVASQPAVAVEALVAMNGLTFNGCTIDGGSFGWSDYAIKGTAAVSGLRGESSNMLNNSDAIWNTGSSGYWYPGTNSGSALFEQTA